MGLEVSARVEILNAIDLLVFSRKIFFSFYNLAFLVKEMVSWK